MPTYQRAVFICRAQPVHIGHLHLMQAALDEADELIVLIGSAFRAATPKNPWSYEERVRLISEAFRDYVGETENGWTDTPAPSILDRVQFAPLRDYLYNDYRWASEVTARARMLGAADDPTTLLIGSYKDDSSYYLDLFQHWHFKEMPLEKHDGDVIDATDVRTAAYEAAPFPPVLMPSTMKAVYDWAHSDTGAHIIREYGYLQKQQAKWANSPYPVLFTTVDALVVCSGAVLLVKRRFHPGKGLWALPGGYVRPTETLEAAARRELREETKLMVPHDDLKAAFQRMQTFDHPRRSERGRIITHAHLYDLGIRSLPQVKGADDAEIARWLPLADVLRMEDQLFEDHFDIIMSMVSAY
ncbi:MAG: bifunctional nicotinamide-nucleotide adenylyltransferase/Nudix hydroxylase [Rhodothermales bacterium]